MLQAKHLTITTLICIMLISSGCSSASRSFSKGEEMEAEGRYEEAMYSYADAFGKDPETKRYRLRYLKARETAANQRFNAGSNMFSKGDYASAVLEFQAAVALDPTNALYKQQAELSAKLKDAHSAYQEGVEFEKNNKLKEAALAYARALELQPENKEFNVARKRVNELRTKKAEGNLLNLKSAKPITLKFNNAKLKDVFSIITRLSGINFVFDDAVKDQPVTINLEMATFQQTLELLTDMFKLGRRIANENTVVIYPRTPDKIKQYEEMQIRTFHLNYLDAKKAINLIRGLIQVRKIHVVEESNSLVLRDTNEVVQVVERILETNDIAEPEVILDVEVIEVSDKNTHNLGLLLSNYNVQLGGFSPYGKLLANSLTSVSTSSTGSTTTSADITNLVKTFSLQGYSGFVTVPSAQYNFGKTLAKGEVLSNPKIRVKNKEKSKFTVGTRLPITTTSTTGTTGGYSVNVQYVDVGVKLSAEPNIQLNNEISIKLSLEVSSMLSRDKVGVDGATTVVTIGTRNLETVLSLKDGETSIIGGLIQNTKSDNETKVFLLGDIPLIGPLLSNNDASKDKTELVLAITPRLVRGITMPQGKLLSFASGKEDNPSLDIPLASSEEIPVNGSGGKSIEKQLEKQPVAVPLMPRQDLPPMPIPQVPPLLPGMPEKPAQQDQPNIPPNTTIQPPTASTTTTPSPVQQSSATAPQQRAILQLITQSPVLAGQSFVVDVKSGNLKNFNKASFEITYDPTLVEFVSATDGGILKLDGNSTTFSGKAAISGKVSFAIDRQVVNNTLPDGFVLAKLNFKASKKGRLGLGFNSVMFSSADEQNIVIMPFSTAFEIK